MGQGSHVRVLDVTEFYSTRGGGIRSHLDAKSHVLCQRGLTHRIVAPGASDRLETLPNGGAELELIQGPRVPYDPTYHLLWRPDRVAQSVRTFRPDVLEAHSPYVAALGVLAAPRDAYRIRTLVWHSDHLGTYLEPWLTPRIGAARARTLLAPCWAGIRALTAQFAATFVASRSQLEALRGHGASGVELLPFGVDRATFVPRPRPSEAPRRVVACGRMAVEKRWDVVLRAFAEASRHRPECSLLALGDGPERPALERLAAELVPAGRIRFAGFVRDRSELARALADADVFLHGCPHETFGLSVAEALACGLAAVVPVEGGAGEWVDGRRVRGFAGSHPGRAAEQLMALLSLPRSAFDALPMPEVLGVHEHFERLLQRYDQLLARGAQGAKQAA